MDDKLDEKNPSFDEISHTILGISEERWSYVLEMMQDAGLIKGVHFGKADQQRAPIRVHTRDMQITLYGVNYLTENSATSKIINAAKFLKVESI